MHGYLIPSPLGDIALRSEGNALTGLFFVGQKFFPALALDRLDQGAPSVVVQAREQLAAYFAGTLQAFDLPLRLPGTAFQLRVWHALSAIPYGTVTSYGAIAARLGLGASHARAVGSAVGRNPVSIVVPCHRVLAGGGGLAGYAGGLGRKQALLALERGARGTDTARNAPRQTEYASTPR